MNSYEVLEALENGPFRKPAHVWLYEVRNQVGYQRSKVRYADALVISVYPSRGIWVAGIEVKVSRSDWRSELDKPAKAAEIQQYCDYWFVAAPEGVIEASEVPTQWGHLEVGKKVRRRKVAPKLERKVWSDEFVCSVLRKQSEQSNRLIDIGRAEGYQRASEEFDAARVSQMKSDLKALERENRRLQDQVNWKNSELESLRAGIAEFEKSAGIPPTGLVNGRVGRLYIVAQMLDEIKADDFASRLERVARELRSSVKVDKGAA